MNLFSVFEISASGMSVEQSRLAVAASNIANSRTAKNADGTEFKPLALSVRSVTDYEGVVASLSSAGALTGSALPRPVVQGMVPTNAPPKLVFDPGHPDADERGFVSLPGVDPINSMMELMSASRSYQANLRAFDITRSLLQATLEMGKTR